MWQNIFRSVGALTRSSGARAPAPSYVSTLARAAQAREVQGVDWRIDALAGLRAAQQPAPQPARRINSLRDLLRAVAENPKDAVSDGA